MVTNANIGSVIARIRKQAGQWMTPSVSAIAETHTSPFRVLIATILSLRTKDTVTFPACERLFTLADTPESMLQIRPDRIERTIYPVAFYRVKTKTIHAICKTLIERYHSQVPEDLDTLLTLPGVGRKTANLVMILGHGKPAMCVDTHVHRISNRLGYVRTKTPDQTETVLRKKLPRRFWMGYNDLLVAFGQNHCKPVSPWCSTCRVKTWCSRAGVRQSR